MEDTQDDTGPSEQRSRNATWWPSGFTENFGSLSLVSKDENPRNKELNDKEKYDRLLYKRASQILWSEGMLSEPIPNGFYSVVPEKRLKELCEDIPTLEELHALELEGLRADVILVDADKDRKLSMLKQLIIALVKGMKTKTAAVIKKIAGLVSDFYKRPNSELSPKKAAQEEASHLTEHRGVQMLGQIRHGSCRPRAILFKVLADTVGLECRLVVGLPTEGASKCVDSHKHMSVLVVLNSVEFLVDLMRVPGQLVPLSTKAIFMTHISAAGESDSAENDSCDSSMEPNSPLYGVSERVDPESYCKSLQEDGLAYQRRLEVDDLATGKVIFHPVDHLYTVEEPSSFWICAIISSFIDDWWYLACKKCHRKLVENDNIYDCSGCKKSYTSGIYRYKVRLEVLDSTANVSVLCGDREAEKLIGRSCHDLRVEFLENRREFEDLPDDLLKLIDRTALFKVTVRDEQIHNESSAFSVSRVVTETTLVAMYNK